MAGKDLPPVRLLLRSAQNILLKNSSPHYGHFWSSSCRTSRQFSTRSLLHQIESRSIKPKPLPRNARSSTPAPSPPPPVPRPRLNPDRASLAAASQSLAHDLTTHGPILLYTSPAHGKFYLMSYLCGTGLLLGCVIIAQDVLKDRDDRPTLSWWVKLLSAVQVVGVTCIGTAFLLAPTKLIQAVKLVPGLTSAQAPFLRFEVKRGLPFLKPDVMEAELARVSVSRRVVGEDIKPLSVPFAEARAFLERYEAKGKGKDVRLPGVPDAPRVGVLAGFKREVRRMFLRDQMAYVTVAGNGLFKMDLQGALLLDGGRPLMRLVTVDAGNSRNLFARLQSTISG